MINKTKIITLALIVFSLSLATYIGMGAKKEKVGGIENNIENPIVKIDLETYKKDITEVYLEIRNLVETEIVSSASTTTEIIEQGIDDNISAVNGLKEKLLSIKAPTIDFGELHLNLVTVLNSYESYLKTPEDELKEKSIELLNKTQEDYNWLSS